MSEKNKLSTSRTDLDSYTDKHLHCRKNRQTFGGNEMSEVTTYQDAAQRIKELEAEVAGLKEVIIKAHDVLLSLHVCDVDTEYRDSMREQLEQALSAWQSAEKGSNHE